MKYEIEVIVRRPKFKDKKYIDIFELDYSDQNFERCENEIRDRLVTLGNTFIEDAFYSQ